jgi:hypothetical protein
MIRMPRYFFHLELDDRVLLDPEGRELPNLAAARSRARQVARRMRSAGVAGVHEPSTVFHIIGTVPGLPFTVPFAEADEPTAMAA